MCTEEDVRKKEDVRRDKEEVDAAEVASILVSSGKREAVVQVVVAYQQRLELLRPFN